jgi:hypothetical protein
VFHVGVEVGDELNLLVAGKWLTFDTRTTAPANTTDLFPWLPATDDHEILSRIVLRATILANDEQLANRHLLRQIRHR